MGWQPYGKANKHKRDADYHRAMADIYRESTEFGDTIKNSEAKMTKVKVTEGKEAIRNHPIYTTKEAWDHYAQELAEQEALENTMPVLDAQQELDEIAKLAGLPTKEASCMECGMLESSCGCSHEEGMEESKCASCGCADCKCSTLDEAATRKDFRMVADLIKNIPDLEKRKELAHHHSAIFKQQNPRFKHDVFCKACGLDECDWNMNPAMTPVEEETATEGNEFSGALAAAKASGEKEFEVGGKKYTVKEDINMNVTANGEEDVVNLIRKLSGMPVAVIAQEGGCGCGTTPCSCSHEEELDEQHANHNVVNRTKRPIENLNTPREDYAAADITTMTGTGYDKKKTEIEYAPPIGDNPLQAKRQKGEVREQSLWKQYEDMLNEITK